jgi:hypothetical protein
MVDAIACPNWERLMRPSHGHLALFECVVVHISHICLLEIDYQIFPAPGV